MDSYSIKNAGALCETFKSLLEYDLEYLKSHPNPMYRWGNVSSNLQKKFNQFDELATLPVFEPLAVHGYQIDKILLYYINPLTTKILWNTDIDTNVLNKCSIIIPIDYTPKSSYLWYDPDYVKPHHQMKDFPDLFKNHGTKIIASSQNFEEGIPQVMKHQNNWAGIFNKNNPSQFAFLMITLKGNPDYEEVISIF